MMLRTIHNTSQVEQGLYDVLDAGAVPVCIYLLQNELPEVRMHAARTLGFLCFADVAKDQAIVEGAVPRLIALLKQQPTDVRVAATSALMAITSTDEGKRQILPCGGVPFLLELLFDSSRIVQINTLKIIANAAVFPPIRKILREDEECLSTLKIMAEGSDSLLKKHATVALNATLWMP